MSRENRGCRETLDLAPYWGFRWLNLTRLNSFAIGTIFLLLVLGNFMALESALDVGVTQPQLKWVVATISAGFLTIWLVLAQGAQKDYKEIQRYSESDLPDFSSHITSPSRTFRSLELLFGLALGYFISFAGRAISQGESILSTSVSLFQDFKSGIAIGLYSVLISLVFMLSGIFMVRTITFLFHQIRLFSRVAHHITLDLLNPEPLAGFANQPLRTFLGVVGLTSTIPLTLSASSGVSRTLIPIGLPMLGLMLLALLLVSLPLWIIRRRLKQAKADELALIFAAIKGNRSALSKSRIAAYQEQFGLPELLYYEDRIRGVWEWPLHAHIRRIALYVILPPLAWVLAAIVELFVDTALQ